LFDKARFSTSADADVIKTAKRSGQSKMSAVRSVLFVLLALGTLSMGGCAGLRYAEPIDVLMVGVEPLKGEGLELRMLVKLRVQNPNDLPLDFNGVSIRMDVQGRRFATGVSNATGTVPRFGEMLVSVPVSISVFRIVRQAVAVVTSEYQGELTFRMTGKLARPALGSVRFKSTGVLTLPSELFERDY
jgi:LEA14-like dessication related protein